MTEDRRQREQMLALSQVFLLLLILPEIKRKPFWFEKYNPCAGVGAPSDGEKSSGRRARKGVMMQSRGGKKLNLPPTYIVGWLRYLLESPLSPS